MNHKEYLLSKLAEEASEVAQIAIKCQVFGFNSVDPRENGDNNHMKLQKELLDMYAILKLLFPNYHEEGLGVMTESEAEEYVKMKLEKIMIYWNVHEGLKNDL